MNKKIILAIIVGAIAVIAFFSYLLTYRDSGGATVSPDDPVILFYGRECPHCKNVEEFIEKNKIKEKVQFVSAEVYHNTKNQEIFVEKNKLCGKTDEDGMGVPFLWVADGKKCYVGQNEVIKYFQEKMQ